MTFTHTDPFRDLFGGRHTLARFFEPTAQQGSERLREPAAGHFIPPVDISETDDKLLLRAELPGLNEEQIDIQIDDSVLLLKGERKFENDQTDENFHRVERCYGSFSRSFTLPTNVDEDAISAQFDHGVLTIDIPKRAEEKPKTVKVQITNGPG